ncbi:hypothetical protein HPB47_021133, partial [Ixodes persulcatus]
EAKARGWRAQVSGEMKARGASVPSCDVQVATVLRRGRSPVLLALSGACHHNHLCRYGCLHQGLMSGKHAQLPAGTPRNGTSKSLHHEAEAPTLVGPLPLAGFRLLMAACSSAALLVATSSVLWQQLRLAGAS